MGSGARDPDRGKRDPGIVERGVLHPKFGRDALFRGESCSGAFIMRRTFLSSFRLTGPSCELRGWAFLPSTAFRKRLMLELAFFSGLDGPGRVWWLVPFAATASLFSFPTLGSLLNSLFSPACCESSSLTRDVDAFGSYFNRMRRSYETKIQDYAPGTAFRVQDE